MLDRNRDVVTNTTPIIKQAITAMQNHGIWLSQNLIDAALKQVH